MSAPGTRGERLIFIVSQPRAGSTLLQRILGSHPEIYAGGETWMMLLPVYGLRDAGLSTEYSATLARQGLETFLETAPQGEEAYIEGMRRMYGYLYDSTLSAAGKRFFVDKCPRYYHILPELQRVFPEARFVFLFRNPLAVVCSGLQMVSGPYRAALPATKQDSLRAPGLLVEALRSQRHRSLVVHYEDLVANPEREVQRLCTWIGVDFDPSMLEYRQYRPRGWIAGDYKIFHRGRPDAGRAEGWQQDLQHPQTWRIASDVLHWLGPQTVEGMGYSYAALQQTLDASRPSAVRRAFTVPTRILLMHAGKTAHYWSLRVIINLATNRVYRALFAALVRRSPSD